MTEFYNFLQNYTPYILLPIVLLGFISLIVAMAFSYQLINYLKIKNPGRVKELNEIDIFGYKVYGNNNEKVLRYIFGTLDDGDLNILKIKNQTKKFMLFGLSLFVGGPIVFIILFTICVFSIKH